MKICMAAAYDITDSMAWSGTPYSVWRTMCKTSQEITALNLSAYHTASAKRRNTLRYLDPVRTIRTRTVTSRLGMSRMNPLNSALLRQHCRKEDYDVLLEFGGFLPADSLPPYYVYSDSTHDLSLDFYREQGTLPYGYRPQDLEDVRRAAAFARPIYQHAAGIFCMSQWMANSLIHTTGVPPERVHTVYAGANWHDTAAPQASPRHLPDEGEIHLLLTGKTYLGKGVDLAVQAAELVNQGSDTRYVLHVCGIPDDFPHPECVQVHGFVGKEQLNELLRQCSLFVLPSRFDCFGIAFVEAMAWGLPCIGRNICAMPEIIDAGKNGELISKDDPEELAQKIRSICSDSAKYTAYSESAIRKAETFTWENTVNAMLQVMQADRS